MRKFEMIKRKQTSAAISMPLQILTHFSSFKGNDDDRERRAAVNDASEIMMLVCSSRPPSTILFFYFDIQRKSVRIKERKKERKDQYRQATNFSFFHHMSSYLSDLYKRIISTFSSICNTI